MFCPNCGNDCGNAKFCVKCGTKVEQAANEPAEWSVGMPCPHCGGTKLEGQNCAFCGAQLASDCTRERMGTGQRKLSLAEINLNDYYDKYQPDRAAAIKALNADTGMGIRAAKNWVDQIFNSHEDQMKEYVDETDLDRSRRILKHAWSTLWKNTSTQ